MRPGVNVPLVPAAIDVYIDSSPVKGRDPQATVAMVISPGAALDPEATVVAAAAIRGAANRKFSGGTVDDDATVVPPARPKRPASEAVTHAASRQTSPTFRFPSRMLAASVFVVSVLIIAGVILSNRLLVLQESAVPSEAKKDTSGATTASPSAPGLPAATAPIQSEATLSNSERAEYKARTLEITQAPWWLSSLDQDKKKQESNTTTDAWVKETMARATVDAWPRAQWVLGILHCGYTQPTLVPHSPGLCGLWLGKALSNKQLTADVDANEVAEWLNFLTKHFDYQVKRHDHAFANAVLPGLHAQSAQSAGVSIRLAYTLACAVKPVRPADALKALEAVLSQNSTTGDERTQADAWTRQLKSADYSMCF